MEKLTVCRDDGVYECSPDLAQASDGTLVLTYRESGGHLPQPFSRIIVRRSEDGGYTWSERRVLCEKNSEKDEGGLNCPRVAALADGTRSEGAVTRR